MTAPLGPMQGAGAAATPALGPFAQYSPYAWMLPQDLWQRQKRWFIYTIEWVTPNQLTANGTVTRTVGINRDSYFALVAMSAVVTNTDNTTFVDAPAQLWNIQEAGAGALISDNPVHFLSLFGRGGAGDGRHWTCELPRLFNPGTTISAQVQNLEATARHVRLALRGFRVYV